MYEVSSDQLTLLTIAVVTLIAVVFLYSYQNYKLHTKSKASSTKKKGKK
jgi:hypothetical protein